MYKASQAPSTEVKRPNLKKHDHVVFCYFIFVFCVNGCFSPLHSCFMFPVSVLCLFVVVVVFKVILCFFVVDFCFLVAVLSVSL